MDDISAMKYRTPIIIGTAVASLVAVVTFALVVWPTIYRYDHINNRETVLPVRIHRLTGVTEILYPPGWRVTEHTDALSTPLRELSFHQVEKLNSTAGVYRSTVSCKIYNGSDWRIREIVINLCVFDAATQTPVIDRDYRLSNDYFTDPLETGIFRDYVGFDVQRGQELSWSIKRAKGEPL